MKDKLLLLRPVSYNLKSPSGINLKSDGKNDEVQFGFIAQEVQEIFPDMVVEQEGGALGIKYSALIPVIIQVIKDQQSEIELLKQQISAEQNKVTD